MPPKQCEHVPEQWATVFEGMQRTLRPAGLLLLHGYRPEQLRSYDAIIEEGAGHTGMSVLIDLVARIR